MNDEYDHRDGSFSLSHTTQNTHTLAARHLRCATTNSHETQSKFTHLYTNLFGFSDLLNATTTKKKPEKNSREEKLCRAESVRE